jgi:PAS domain S-box-containing protein
MISNYTSEGLRVQDSEDPAEHDAVKFLRDKYQSLFERRLHCVYAHDLDGNFLEANEAALDLLGYDRDELLSLNLANLIDDDQLAVARNATEEILRNGYQKSFSVYRLKRKNGTFVWVEMEGSLIYRAGEACMILGIARDVTDRIAADMALKESEARRIGKRLGVELDRFPITHYIHPEDRDTIVERHRKRLKGLKSPHNYSFRLIGKDGREKWVEINTVRVNWKGQPATLNFLRDITLQRKLEQQLQLSQKMEAVGTLAGGIAHDFNNLLMGIQGRTSLMLMETDRVHPFYEHLKETENYVMRAAELTKQLLGFARGGKYEVRPTDLNDLVSQSSGMFGRTKKEITIKSKYHDQLYSVEVDRSQIDQVLLNIYVNAWQAMPEGGVLYIQTANVELDENFVKAYGIRSGKYAAISISDTGIGMDEQVAKRVFDPFFTTKEKDRGTGLGLASAYGIIKNHDGIITVDSKKGMGATFTVYLPASDKSIAEGAPVEPEIFTGSETILLVDDEKLIIDVGIEMLKRMGYRVITASDGKQAVEIYRQNRETIALVILDMIMPQISGGEIFDQLKEIDSDVKVLLSSGYSVDGQATEILNRGCDGFIQKPFRVDELSKRIRSILAS